MASAKFLEEALSTDVDESAVNAIVGSLETQLTTTSAPTPQPPTTLGPPGSLLNSAISNGGTAKHGTIANGESLPIGENETGLAKHLTNASSLPGTIITGAAAQAATGAVQNQFANQQSHQPLKASEGIKIVTQQSMPNGTIGLQPQTTTVQLQQQQQANTTSIQTTISKQPTLVIKTSGAPGGGLVTVPMNVTSVPQVNSQLTLQSLHGLQPGQQGHLLLKTENGQYQLLRVGPAPAVTAGLTSSSAAPGAPLTFRMQTVPAGAAPTPVTTQPAVAPGATTATTAPTVQTTTSAQKPTNDNTKEKCRKFLANLLELSSREPRSVERSVRTLIQELIDMRVEPEDFCDRLEKLLNASPQPCLIGFLKKSLPLLRHSLATKELSIDGIRPPPPNVVFSIVSGTPTVQTQVRPVVATSQVRLVSPGTAVVKPGQVVQQRLVTPVRGTVQQATRMVTAIRQPNSTAPVIVSSSQPPALHPVFPNNQQVRPGVNMVRTITPGQIRPPMAVRTTAPPIQMRTPLTNFKTQTKPTVPSTISKPMTKDKEKKSFSSSAAYAGDDDINDVAAMGGVNLAEETQRILGSTEFVGTQIRSCKEEFLLSMGPLQQKIRSALTQRGLDEPSHEVGAILSHAIQERLKNLVEKLAIITEHRLEMVKGDQRYAITNDIKGQLKFLEDVDRAERKRHEELERELLLRAAKSRSKTEDPEQAKLKAKAKEMQRVEMEELRQREANATALQAIGPRKKPRLENEGNAGALQASVSGFNNSARGQLPLRARIKKVTLKDLQFLFETEKDLCKSTILYKSYLK